jgi:dUTP pyrophosphatase
MITIKSGFKTNFPERKTIGSVGYDLKASLNKTIKLKPNRVALIGTNIFLDLPENYYAQIVSRSGLALKGLIVLNSPGIIDNDYKGEIKVILMNLYPKKVIIEDGDRIAQILYCKYEKNLPIKEVIDTDMYYNTKIANKKNEEIKDEVRGKKGFGSTGIK